MYLYWLGISITLLIIESLTKKGFYFWIAFIAGVVGLTQWIFPSLSIWIQLGLFFCCLIFSMITWKYFLKNFLHQSDKIKTPRHAHNYLNQIMTLEHPTQNKIAKIFDNETIWRVLCPQDLPRGAQIKIVRIDGVVLIGEPVD